MQFIWIFPDESETIVCLWLVWNGHFEVVGTDAQSQGALNPASVVLWTSFPRLIVLSVFKPLWYDSDLQRLFFIYPPTGSFVIQCSLAKSDLLDFVMHNRFMTAKTINTEELKSFQRGLILTTTDVYSFHKQYKCIYRLVQGQWIGAAWQNTIKLIIICNAVLNLALQVAISMKK